MLLSIRKYAKYRGCSHTAVRKALATGRITKRPDGKIDTRLADEQWKANTRLAVSLGTGTVSRARAVREHYMALLAKLEYEEKVGKLIPIANVVRDAFNKARRIRDRILNIPDRFAAPITALARTGDLEGIHRMLVDEIVAALAEE